jgi:hypothetical protein
LVALGGGRFVFFRWIGRVGVAAFVGQTPGPARLVGEEILDLGVDAAEVVVGPAAQRGEEARIESQQEALALGHLGSAQV